MFPHLPCCFPRTGTWLRKYKLGCCVAGGRPQSHPGAPRTRHPAVPVLLLLCFQSGKKKEDSMSVSWFLHSENEIFYEVLNLVVIVPLPIETTVKTPFCCHQHVLWAPSVPIPWPQRSSREERPLLGSANDSHRRYGAPRR